MGYVRRLTAAQKR